MSEVLPEIKVYSEAIDTGDYVDPFDEEFYVPDEDLRNREQFASTHPVIFTPKRLELKHEVDINDEKFKEEMRNIEEKRVEAERLIKAAEKKLKKAEDKRVEILEDIKVKEKRMGYSRTAQKKDKTKKAQAAPAGGPPPEVEVKSGDTDTLKRLRKSLIENEEDRKSTR